MDNFAFPALLCAGLKERCACARAKKTRRLGRVGFQGVGMSRFQPALRAASALRKMV